MGDTSPSTKTTAVTVDLRLYDVSVVKQVCYRFAGRYFSALDLSQDASAAVATFSFPATLASDQQDVVLQDFQSDLIDQDLRQRIAKDTELTRQLILANAFADTALANQEDE